MKNSIIKVEVASDTIKGANKIINAIVLDKCKITSSAQIGNEFMLCEQTAYLVKDSENKVHTILPIQIKEHVSFIAPGKEVNNG